jgi:hypothetical protein
MGRRVAKGHGRVMRTSAWNGLAERGGGLPAPDGAMVRELCLGKGVGAPDLATVLPPEGPQQDLRPACRGAAASAAGNRERVTVLESVNATDQCDRIPCSGLGGAAQIA